MNSLEKVVYAIVVVCAFAYGLIMPLVVLDEPLAGAEEMHADIDALLGGRPFVVVIVAACCAMASAATMYIAVRVCRDQPTVVRILLKLSVIALPAVAIGAALFVVLALIDVCETPYSLTFFGIGAVAHLCGGIAGIAAMRSIPEYKQLLKKGNALETCQD